MPKSKEKKTEDIKNEFKSILNSLFNDVSDIQFSVNCNNDTNNRGIVNYNYIVKNDRTLFLKLESYLSEMEAAKLLDYTVNKLIKGSHRKDYEIIITYSESSLVFCNKLIPFFGKFERRLRQILYITLVGLFQSDWLSKSFEETLLNELKGKSDVNKNKLIESALDELTYEQLKQFLFERFSTENFEEIINNQLSEDNIQNLPKENIVTIIDSCRKKSLWERFFYDNNDLKNIPSDIIFFQIYRNRVMHNKSISYEDFRIVRSRLKRSINNLMNTVIDLNVSLYYSEHIHDVYEIVKYFSESAKAVMSNITPALKLLAESMSDAVKNYNLYWKDSMKQLAEGISKIGSIVSQDKYCLSEKTTSDRSEE